MVIFWSLSLLFLCLLLRLSFPSVVREVVHLPWSVRLGHLNVVVALSSFFLLSCPLLAYADTATPSNASRVDADTDWDMDMDDIWVASPSDAAYTDVDLLIDDRTLMDIDDFEDLKRDDLLRYILCELITIRDSFGVHRNNICRAFLQVRNILRILQGRKRSIRGGSKTGTAKRITNGNKFA